MSRVAIIGGGPAGMMCASEAAHNGHSVTLYERNEKLGKKLFITLNMRSYFSDNEIELFIGEIKRKQLYVLMLENCARKKITGSDQLIIDSDLCEF